MYDIERDIYKAIAGKGEELVYKTLTGLKDDLSIESKPVLLKDGSKLTTENDKCKNKFYATFFNFETKHFTHSKF